MLIISQYICSQYCKKLFIVTSIVLVLVLVLNIFDSLAKFKSVNLNMIDFIKLVLYKTPYLFVEISPILVLISVLFFLQQLIYTNQLTNILNTGFSLMILVKATLLINLIFGLVILIAISPLSSNLLGKYDAFKNRISAYAANNFNDILLKELHDGQRFIYIKNIDFNTNQMKDIIILTLEKDSFSTRLNCKTAIMYKGYWKMQECIKYSNNHTPQPIENLDFITKLEKQLIKNQSIPIYHMPFWQLATLIKTSTQLGLKTTVFEICYYKQLFRPIVILLLGLVPFYFVEMQKFAVFRNSLDSLILGVILFVCFNIIINFLIQYLDSAIICTIVPIILCVILSIIMISNNYKYQR